MFTKLQDKVFQLVLDGESLLTEAEQLREVGLVEFSPNRARAVRNVIAHYHAWYNAARPLIKDNLTEMFADFESLYSTAAERAPRLTHGDRPYETRSLLEFEQSVARQLGLVKGPPQSLESKAVALRGLMTRELHSDELSVARELLAKGFAREAGMIAGVALEGHLKYLCAKYGKAVGKGDTLNPLNQRLLEFYPDASLGIRVEWMAKIRNQCAHKGDQDPDPNQIQQMIGAVTDFMSAMA